MQSRSSDGMTTLRTVDAFPNEASLEPPVCTLQVGGSKKAAKIPRSALTYSERGCVLETRSLLCRIENRTCLGIAIAISDLEIGDTIIIMTSGRLERIEQSEVIR